VGLVRIGKKKRDQFLLTIGGKLATPWRERLPHIGQHGGDPTTQSRHKIKGNLLRLNKGPMLRSGRGELIKLPSVWEKKNHEKEMQTMAEKPTSQGKS